MGRQQTTLFHRKLVVVLTMTQPLDCLPDSRTVLAVFTNRVEDLRLQDLAEMDTKELVTQVQEFFGDFQVLDPHHFAVPLPRPYIALQPFNWEYGNRCTRLPQEASCQVHGAR